MPAKKLPKLGVNGNKQKACDTLNEIVASIASEKLAELQRRVGDDGSGVCGRCKKSQLDVGLHFCPKKKPVKTGIPSELIANFTHADLSGEPYSMAVAWNVLAKGYPDFQSHPTISRFIADRLPDGDVCDIGKERYRQMHELLKIM